MTAEQTKRFKYWQWRTIIGTMIGYAIFYFVRKNFSFAIPGLTAEYGISKTTFGVIMTLVGLIYGVSKFVNGVLADRTNGRWHMVTGLSVCSVINFIFGCGAIICAWITGQTYGTTFIHTLVVLFGVLLILNNMFQGCGFPPCNRLITHWVPPKELATKMSIWNASHSIGAFIIAILCGYLMGHTGTDMTGDPEMRQRVVENTASITEKMDAASAEAYVTNALQHVGAWQWTFWVPAAIAVLGVIFIIVTVARYAQVGRPARIGGHQDAARRTRFVGGVQGVPAQEGLPQSHDLGVGRGRLLRLYRAFRRARLGPDLLAGVARPLVEHGRLDGRHLRSVRYHGHAARGLDLRQILRGPRTAHLRLLHGGRDPLHLALLRPAGVDRSCRAADDARRGGIFHLRPAGAHRRHRVEPTPRRRPLRRPTAWWVW